MSETATDGGGWIACSERLPEAGVDVEVITYGSIGPRGWVWDGRPTYWRPRGVDRCAASACLFSGRYRPTVEQARSAARHVAGCAECRSKLEAKGGA